MRTTLRPLVVAAATAVILTSLCGCGLGASSTTGAHAPAGSGGTASKPPSSSPTGDSSASHQVRMTAVPTTCPSADEISLGISYSVPSVGTANADPLECEYYNASDTSHVLFLEYGPSNGATPSVMRTKVLAVHPDAVLVSGVGDAAYYDISTTDGKQLGTMQFLSGAVTGFVYGPVDIATQAKLTHLVADFLLVP